jgi:hypothetical protein
MLIKEFPISNRTKNALEKAGFVSHEDFEGKTREEIQDTPGLGPSGLIEIREYLHSKFNIVFKPKPKDKKIENFKQSQRIVSHLLGHSKKIFWGKELKTANTLLKYHSFEFLSTVIPNKFVNTLSYYFTEVGKTYLKNYKPIIGVIEKKQERIEEPHLEEVEEIKLNFDSKMSGPKSVRDFLKA